MPTNRVKQAARGGQRQSRIAAEVVNTFEWLIIAFVLAFVFRAFVMEAFRIPTGSMADTLMGSHLRLRCPQCGYRFEYGRDAANAQPPNMAGVAMFGQSCCPSCGYHLPSTNFAAVSNGDRILVLKCIYQFFEPKRWDVIVFKNPLDPKINYIKRLIGRPSETVEVIDGDVYIDGQISRKPPKVQSELWMPVFVNDYQPVRPDEPLFNGHRWEQPFRNTAGSSWQIDKDNPRRFVLDSPSQQIHTLKYDTSTGNDFRSSYAYNDAEEYQYRPYCSDLMVRFYVGRGEKECTIAATLRKYETQYSGRLEADGMMVISRIRDGREEQILSRTAIEMPQEDRGVFFSFANVDHELVLRLGDEKLIFDLGRSPEDAGPRKSGIEPEVEISGSGKITLTHIAIFRDTHYISRQQFGRGRSGRGTEGVPIELADDEFFVLGDNSPNSQDGRWWAREGIGNDGRRFRKGIVPREYLVGKAMFVYWPSGYEFPWPRGMKTYFYRNSRRNGLFWSANKLIHLKWIPDIARMRFIYGGSSKGRQQS